MGWWSRLRKAKALVDDTELRAQEVRRELDERLDDLQSTLGELRSLITTSDLPPEIRRQLGEQVEEITSTVGEVDPKQKGSQSQ